MVKQPGPIHDKYFRRLMADPQTAALFFQEHLPAKLSSLMSGQTTELVKENFIDEQLSEHQSDLLYRVGLTGGCTAFVYIFVDHKSNPDYRVTLQLQRYMNRIWDSLSEQKDWRPLPEIWPVVVYHGTKNWTVPTCFSSLFATRSGREPQNIPDFEYHLVDLSKIEDNVLSKNRRLRAFLTVQKHILREDFVEVINDILVELKYLEPMDIMVILNYVIMKHRQKIDRATLDGVLVDIEPERKDEIMAGVVHDWIEEGLAKGLKQGLEKGLEQGLEKGLEQGLEQGLERGIMKGLRLGIIEGEAKLLLKLLERRFGVLPDTEKEKLGKASSKEIELWADRILEASSLDDVFKV